jgi:hypothetical protein
VVEPPAPSTSTSVRFRLWASSSNAGGRCFAGAALRLRPGGGGALASEVAVAFLALLELRKLDEVAIAQAESFSPVRFRAPTKGVSDGPHSA